MRHSAEFRRRSAAAKLGWKRRRASERAEFRRRSAAAKKGVITRARNKRSLAAKKGWETRRKNEAKKKRKRVEETIERLTYKKGNNKPVHMEVVKRGKKIIKITIGKHVYTKPEDIEPFQAIMAASKRMD